MNVRLFSLKHFKKPIISRQFSTILKFLSRNLKNHLTLILVKRLSFRKYIEMVFAKSNKIIIFHVHWKFIKPLLYLNRTLVKLYITKPSMNPLIKNQNQSNQVFQSKQMLKEELSKIEFIKSQAQNLTNFAASIENFLFFPKILSCLSVQLG